MLRGNNQSFFKLCSLSIFSPLFSLSNFTLPFFRPWFSTEAGYNGCMDWSHALRTTFWCLETSQARAALSPSLLCFNEHASIPGSLPSTRAAKITPLCAPSPNFYGLNDLSVRGFRRFRMGPSCPLQNRWIPLSPRVRRHLALLFFSLYAAVNPA